MNCWVAMRYLQPTKKTAGKYRLWKVNFITEAHMLGLSWCFTIKFLEFFKPLCCMLFFDDKRSSWICSHLQGIRKICQIQNRFTARLKPVKWNSVNVDRQSDMEWNFVPPTCGANTYCRINAYCVRPLHEKPNEQHTVYSISSKNFILSWTFQIFTFSKTKLLIGYY